MRALTMSRRRRFLEYGVQACACPYLHVRYTVAYVMCVRMYMHAGSVRWQVRIHTIYQRLHAALPAKSVSRGKLFHHTQTATSMSWSVLGWSRPTWWLRVHVHLTRLMLR